MKKEVCKTLIYERGEMRLFNLLFFVFLNKKMASAQENTNTNTETNTDSTQSPYQEVQRVYCELLGELQTIFPDHKEKFESFSKEVHEDAEKAVIFIMGNVFPFMEEISLRKASDCVAHGDKMMLAPEFSFAMWWGDGKMDTASQDALWKFLHTFYYLVSTLSNLDKLMETHFPSSHEHHGAILRSLINHQRIANQILTSVMFRESPAGETTGASAGAPGSSGSTGGAMPGMPGFPFGENSAIGQLAREISQEIDVNSFQDIKSPADLFRGLFGGAGGVSNEGAGNGISRLISTVGQKLHDKMSSGALNEMNLMSEAANMMNMMSPMYSQLLSGGLFPPGMGGAPPRRNRNTPSNNSQQQPSSNESASGDKKKKKSKNKKK